MLKRDRGIIKHSRAYSSLYLFPYKKGLFLVDGIIEVEVNPSIKSARKSSHVGDDDRINNICEDDCALKRPSYPYFYLCS